MSETNKFITDYLKKNNTKNNTYITNISEKPMLMKSVDYKISTGNKRYENKIKKLFDEIMKSDDLSNILEIYLKLKNSQYENEDKIIKQLIEEIKKNKFTDVQYFILALLIYRLINFQNLNIKHNNRINNNKTGKYIKYIFGEIENFSINNEKLESIIKITFSKNPKKIEIILRFIDEYIAVSIENSEFGKKINYILDNFVKKNI